MSRHGRAHPHPPVAFLPARARLLIALLLGIGGYVLLSAAGWPGSISLRVALAWDIAAATYLTLAIVMMWRHDEARIRARARAIDISLPEIVTIVMLAGLFSLFAVAKVLGEGGGLAPGGRGAHIGVGVLTVLLSWFAMHVIYAVHYAHIYYDPAEREGASRVRGGLDFPGAGEPDYWDFVYISFVIGMTCQVSDVQVTARDMRHLVTAQGIIAFFYNTTVVALAVSIAANLI